jgi:hypothetical protein
LQAWTPSVTHKALLPHPITHFTIVVAHAATQ